MTATQVILEVGPSALVQFSFLFFFFFLSFVFCLSRATPAAYGGSQARGQLELQLLAYTTATGTADPSHVCDLHHISWQHWIRNPLSEARDRTCNLMVFSVVVVVVAVCLLVLA